MIYFTTVHFQSDSEAPSVNILLVFRKRFRWKQAWQVTLIELVEFFLFLFFFYESLCQAAVGVGSVALHIGSIFCTAVSLPYCI